VTGSAWERRCPWAHLDEDRELGTGINLGTRRNVGAGVKVGLALNVGADIEIGTEDSR